MELSDWINIISAILVGGGTLALAYIAYISIQENRRIREEDRERSLKTQALRVVRNWANGAIRLMLLNAKYSDEYQRKDLPSVKKTLEDIQSTKMELSKMLDDLLNSATLFGPDLFSPVDKASQTLIKFVKEGMAEKADIDEQYRHNLLREFANILLVTRRIKDKNPSLRI